MGKSRIEDFTNTESKPKNIIPLGAGSYKTNKKKDYFIS
jgi:hypothetical protein